MGAWRCGILAGGHQRGRRASGRSSGSPEGMGLGRRERIAMTHLLRCLISVLAVAGLAFPSIAPRPARNRLAGFSRAQRLRNTSQAERPHSPAVHDAAKLKLLALGDSGAGDTPAALTTEQVRWPGLTADSALTTAPELLFPSEQHARSPFGRAPHSNPPL